MKDKTKPKEDTTEQGGSVMTSFRAEADVAEILEKIQKRGVPKTEALNQLVRKGWRDYAAELAREFGQLAIGITV